MFKRHSIKWPTRTVLQASNKKIVVILIINLTFMIGVVWLIMEGITDWQIWSSLAFFVFCLCTSVFALIKRNRLVLTHEGFTNNYLGVKRTHRWENVSQFTALKIRTGLFSSVNQIIFETELMNSRSDSERTQQVQIIGGNYRIKVDKLAEILNNYRADAIKNLFRNRR